MSRINFLTIRCTVVDLIEEENIETERHNNKIYHHDKLKIELLEPFSEQKLYRNPDLKIAQISEALLTNRTYVSNLIDKEFSCSFNDFVNNYRVAEAKELLSDPAYDRHSLEYVGETVGFGSLNTFIRVFRQWEGVTPGRYRHKIMKGK